MEKEPFFGSAGWQSTEHLPPTSFFNLNWDQSMEPGCSGNQFDSTLSSLVPPPANPTGPAVESVVLRELIGRLGSICNSGDISPPAAARYVNGSAGAGASCYAAPLHSPPELNLSMIDHQHQQQLLPRTTAPASHLPAFSADPGFVERAAKHSCFGGRSYGGPSGTFLLPDAAAKMSSSQSLAAAGSQNSRDVSMPDGAQFKPPIDKEFGSAVAREGSPVSGPDASLADGNPKKRKAAPKLKGKETAEQSPKDTPKVEEEDLNAKRFKTVETTEKDSAIKPKAEQNSSVSTNGDGGQKQGKNNAKPPEPKQDYIHVRARRGQATDSHSLAERVRREKISERMKFLQDLVPGCNKVTGKAVMLDEIINYVQSLQRQVEFLSMKLATVNPRLDFNIENFLPKDAQQLHGPLPHPLYLMETAATAFSYANQPQQGTPLQSGVTNGLETQCSVNPLDANLHRNLSMQLPPLDGYGEAAYQLGNFWEDELQSVGQMGLMQNQDSAFSSQTFTAHRQQLT